MRGFSLEATRPSADEISALAGILPPGTPIYFSAVPTITVDEIVAAAVLLRRAKLEPVIHIAARRIRAAQDLKDLLARLRGEADVRRLLVIGGDVEPQGPYNDALAVIERGGLSEAGIEEAGIGGYPEGHPKIAPAVLETAMRAKIAALSKTGLRGRIVSQFCFSGDAIIGWVKGLRGTGISLPVSIGLAGPTSVTALLRFAKRCGVNASLRGLGLASSLVGNAGPDRIVAQLEAATGLGDVALHYFSFGGVVETARYAHNTATRRGAESRAMTGSN